MSFIKYKTIKNKKYAYEIISYWDKEKKYSKSFSKYLDPVDSETNEIIKTQKKIMGNEKLILDFGDGYFLYEIIKKNTIFEILNSTLFSKFPDLLPLIIYRLCTQSAMYNCDTWFDGNILSYLVKNSNLSSQRISEILSCLGDELIQRPFLSAYLSQLGGSKKSVIIDATSLPNKINIDFNSWGRSDGAIEKQFRFICVIDQENHTPLFYRLLPGNITDVSTLKTTMLELKAMGVRSSYVLMDAGYYSEANIRDLLSQKIDFLTRMPASIKIYKNLILNKSIGIEHLKNASLFGSRSFYIKSLKIDLYGSKGYAFIILDPERKAKETKKLLQQYCNDTDKSDRSEKKYQLKMLSCGIMILISSKKILVNEILSSYYLRLSVEQIFSCSKSDLALLPIRNHNDKTVQGYLFLQFLLLIIYLRIKEKILNEHTVEQALLILRRLKCKVYDNQIIISELTKKQRMIFEEAKILVPNFLGI